MRRALTALLTFAALATAAASAAAQHRVHVHEVRVGAHADFARVVVELDGPADVSWERGPEPGAERFYLDADLGRRSRVVHTGLAQVGDVRLTAMRVGTRVELEPRERRLRAYVLPDPPRLVIDLAPPGPEPFSLPKGIRPLEPATSVEPRSEAAPEAKAEPEPEGPPAEQAGPPAEEVAPEGLPEESRAEPSAEPPPLGEPQAGAAPAPESPGASEEAAPAPAGAEPEAAAPEAAAPEPTPPPAAPPRAAPELPPPAPVSPEPAPGFPWALAFGTVAFIAALVVSYLYVRERMDRAAPALRLPRSPAGALTPSGVDPISLGDLRSAADATSVLEQRLDEEVRARVALEERLAQAGEELKLLRDRVHRVERRREEAH